MYLKDRLNINRDSFTEILNVPKTSLKTFYNTKKDIYYKIKSYDECLLFIVLLYNDINIELFPEKHEKDILRFQYIFNIRNDFEINNLSIVEIYSKYNKISRNDINKIITYEIYDWYKPLKFISRPLIKY